MEVFAFFGIAVVVICIYILYAKMQHYKKLWMESWPKYEAELRKQGRLKD